ncbi:aspartate-semialdehyde dehydrogenase [Bifidobacterium tibiigranuli]|jgi:aspartate-semialdehyde dehydrogenase|uniref:aspartate-semialdehyde dehydrogenase n=1 Tax=Bifidobacterium tibiigranuli TaxID=2172043 RepID=UPI0026EA59EC|nr:aspartate-semialdehyde dehydrogenase [Bifidobacterium tibiigranuli]MCI1650471.1 aspartate-semialdehyde dehydrogenase [Bifidobacterium tibiigranuli]MCI2186093.1 aspartate-semialdehyde dehydrogenase [Bifidobacterium tibiigranuli]MCI2204138.1 aspartate-semialdehyde dehydrogenase [Bifidobacterium tibiigranuli]
MVQIHERGVNVAVLGATGQVGMVMRRVLDERDFPVRDLRFLASAHSAGTTLTWRGVDIPVEDVEKADLSGIDIAIFSAGGGTSKIWAPRFAEAGAYVVDNSSQWRMHDDVPLVVAEANPDDLDDIPSRIVANPNCTTMACIPVLKALDTHFGLKRLIVSSYQAVSGAGRAGVEQLMNEAAAAIEQGADKLAFDGSAIDFPEPTKVVRTIAFNAVPFIGAIVDDGSEETDEEQKLRNESRKILHLPNLAASCTCVRVGIFTAHGMSVNAEFERDVTPDMAREVLATAPAVELDDIPTPQLAAGKDPSYVGRIRQDQAVDGKKGLAFFIANDNLRKGAALNAVELAEIIARKHFAEQL